LSREKGFKAEEKVCKYLEDLGFEIIDRNFYSKFGEIDVIAEKNGVIHFIEVKSSQKSDINPIYNITYKKLSKIKKTLSFYLFKNQITLPFCIDAAIVKEDEIEFYENITVF